MSRILLFTVTMFITGCINSNSGEIKCIDLKSVKELLKVSSDIENILLPCLSFKESSSSYGIIGHKYSASYGQYENTDLKQSFSVVVFEKDGSSHRGLGFSSTDRIEYLRVKKIFEDITSWTKSDSDLIGFIKGIEYILISINDRKTIQGNTDYTTMIMPREFEENLAED